MPCRGSSLAVVDGHLTSIGGYEKKYPTNKLLILAHGRVKWTEHFPPMPTKRGESVAVTFNQHLIVAGGSNWTSNHLCTVEIMDVETLQWSAMASLSEPYTLMHQQPSVEINSTFWVDMMKLTVGRKQY